MLTWTPPLAHVTGTVQPGEVFGGFGPVDAFTWRGSCVGGCGARPGCREESPQPECSGCGRRRHGITHAGAVGRIVPVPARILPGELDGGGGQSRSPVPFQRTPATTTVLRPAVEVGADDASLPAAVRGLVQLAPHARLTAAVAVRDGAVVASVAVRVRGVGWAVYERGEDGAWGFAGGALVVPHLRRCNVGQFKAALTGEEYVPPAPREPIRGCCVKCRAEVSITAAGAIYANHRCGTSKAVEGRS